MDEIKAGNQQKSPLSLRAGLFIAQILIPFGLYWAMNRASLLGMGIFAAAYVIAMGVLVWLR